MSNISETDLSMMLWGRSPCPYCGCYVLCLARHQCSTEQPVPARVPDVDREPVDRLPRRERV